MAEKKQGSKEASGKDIMEVPDYLKGVTGPDAGSMATGVGTSVPRLSLKGRQFRFIEDGDEILKTQGPIEIVILGVEPEIPKLMSKTWYEHGYQPGSTDPPDCSSWDGIRPDSWVNKPQSALCANCKQTVWGSATSMGGKKAKACKESKRLIITRREDLEGTSFTMNVTIASLKALDVYGKFLAKNNIPYSAAITEVSFVDSDFPEVEFDFKGYLDAESGPKMMTRAEEKEWKVYSSSPELPNNMPAQQQITGKTTTVPEHTDDDAPATEEDVKSLVKNW